MVEINLSMREPYKNKVIIDGMDITNNLVGIKVEKTASTIPCIELKLIPDEIKITGDMLVIRDKGLNEYTKEELINELAERLNKVVKADL